MDVNEVPQEGNRTLGRHRKALYARDVDGRMVIVPSRGSEVDETVTMQAVDRMHAFAQDSLLRARNGTTSALEYWMWAKRMDVPLLSQVSGIWEWRIRRHFRPAIFLRLSPRIQARYADALGLSVEQLRKLP